jgi:hypothetical protein
MNDQDFILLMEQYFDGSLSPDGRATLRAELAANPERRRIFEEQSRQHVRIHAQTSRVDFTESQRIAMMAVDIAEKHRDPPASIVDILREPTLRERFQAVRRGLRAPRGSAPYRYARFMLQRFFTPPIVALAVNAIAIYLLVFVWVPSVRLPEDEPSEGTVIAPVFQPTPPSLDRTPREPESATRAPDRAAPVPTPPPEAPPDDSGGPERGGPTATPGPVPPEGEGAIALPPPLREPLRLPLPTGTLRGRDPASRAKMLGKPTAATGNPRTERAVTGALAWLRDRQLEDGSWAGQDPVAMTGLALLAYLAHGEVPGVASPYNEAVGKGLKYLLSRQDSRGAFSKNAYAHAIGAYAVAEAFTLTRIMGLRDAMEKAVQLIIEGQQSTGGFDYNYAKGDRFDTSVTGWQIQALKAAKIARAGNTGLEAAIERAVRFLQTQAFARDGGGFVYDGRPGVQAASGARWSMTGVGTLCLQFLDKPNAPQLRLGLKALRDISFEWKTDAKPPLYGYYYVTQAKFHQANPTVWQAWNAQMQAALLKHQHADGHWENGDYDQGSHVYTTTLCTLMLEVYYRYLPTFEKVQGDEALARGPAGEVSVDVR